MGRRPKYNDEDIINNNKLNTDQLKFIEQRLTYLKGRKQNLISIINKYERMRAKIFDTYKKPNDGETIFILKFYI